MATGGMSILMIGLSNRGILRSTSLRLEALTEKMMTRWTKMTTLTKKTGTGLFLALRATYISHRGSLLTQYVLPNVTRLVLWSMIGHNIVHLAKLSLTLWVSAWSTLPQSIQNWLFTMNITHNNTVMVRTTVERKPWFAKLRYFCGRIAKTFFQFYIMLYKVHDDG